MERSLTMGWWGRHGKGLEGFDICESRMRNADGQGFDSPQVHVLTEEQEKDLDEMAKRFKDTLGGGK